MSAMVASRQDNMSGFNSSLDMDDVHTPARYIALFFFFSIAGVLGFIFFCRNNHVVRKSCTRCFSFSYWQVLRFVLCQDMTQDIPFPGQDRTGQFQDRIFKEMEPDGCRRTIFLGFKPRTISEAPCE